MKLMIAGGGTGGHVYPGISLAREWLKRGPDYRVSFVGTKEGLEARVLPREGFDLHTIKVGRLKGQGAGSKLLTLLGLPASLVQSRRIIKKLKPDIAIGVGGYVSGPVILAAWLCRIPVFIQEQNSIPGMTNKLLSRYARLIFTSFPEAESFFKKAKVRYYGNPVREEIAELKPEKSEDERLMMLVFGGSQGAARINAAVIDALPHLEDIRGRLYVVHQTGEKDRETMEKAYAEAGFEAEVHAFIYDMPDFYRRAGFVVCRAGATSIAELLCAGLPAIYIPFPYAADNHQEKNALSLVERDAAMMIVEKDLSGEALAEMIRELVTSEEKRAELKMKARQLARPDAAADIIDQCLETIGSKN
jgi:UDP-N-acetylglucosamine--N-acetylmuramyl-(pentapeptide) pyrophosphoryl-undecaprenol N-acetylglucosamine transferase